MYTKSDLLKISSEYINLTQSSSSQSELELLTKNMISYVICSTNESLIMKLKRIVEDESVLKSEIDRLENNSRIKSAISKGENVFTSTISCRNCNSNIRYISNRGCKVCQLTADTPRSIKKKRIWNILNKNQHLDRSELVKVLMNSLDIGKSSAYNAIKELGSASHSVNDTNFDFEVIRD